MPKCNGCGITMNDGFNCNHEKMDGKSVCYNCCSGRRNGKMCKNYDALTKLCKLRLVNE